MGDQLAVVLDTDIGTNIDDALALVYLLAQPRCDLLGITTVTGQPEVRAQLADLICRSMGCSGVPIHAGHALPLRIVPEQVAVPHAEVLDRWPHRASFSSGTAIDFLAETIRARPGGVTLLTIGPLSNVAALFAEDPEIAHLLGGMMTMGGFFASMIESLRPETNMRLDPHAARQVFSAELPRHRCIGLDVTRRCELARAEFDARVGRNLPDVVQAMAEVWFRRQRETVTLHDPLAAVSLFEPDLCRFQRGRINPVVNPPDRAGCVQFSEASDGPHHVAADVDVERFLNHYSDVVSRAVDVV